jgi:hypothetical protein
MRLFEQAIFYLDILLNTLRAVTKLEVTDGVIGQTG